MKKDFWKRLETAMSIWLPEFSLVADWVAWLLAGRADEAELERQTQVVYNWKNKGATPRRRISQLADLFSRLRERGADPRALAAHVYSGAGRMPRPSGGSIIDDVSAPSPASQPETRSGVVVPAIPVTLLEPVARVMRRVAAREARDLESDEGRGDLEALEVATAFEKWVRSLPEEVRAQLGSRPGPGSTSERPSNLLQHVDDWAVASAA